MNYRVIGLISPGLVNVRIDGKFRDVKLFEVDQIVLEKLHKDGCPFVIKIPEGFIADDKKAITVNSIESPKTVIPKKNKPQARDEEARPIAQQADHKASSKTSD